MNIIKLAHQLDRAEKAVQKKLPQTRKGKLAAAGGITLGVVVLSGVAAVVALYFLGNPTVMNFLQHTAPSMMKTAGTWMAHHKAIVGYIAGGVVVGGLAIGGVAALVRNREAISAAITRRTEGYSFNEEKPAALEQYGGAIKKRDIDSLPPLAKKLDAWDLGKAEF